MNNELPKNWFKRFSRKKRRGKEYYYNKETREKSWTHPKANFAKRSVLDWLHETVQVSHSTENYRDTLESEYKKFEVILAEIERDSISCNSSSFDSLSDDNQCVKHTSDSSQFSSMDGIHHAQYISLDDEKAVEEVSLIRHREEQASQQFFGNIYQEPGLRSFYVVVDTNIFLSQITFLGVLLRKMDEIPGNPMLVVPYVVLQELDKLKMRTENSISILALNAIGFISEQLKTMPNRMLGQSAMDSRNKFIEIRSAHDSIINCCLQFELNFGNVKLLTNDLSLSNHAICSRIEAFTKSEFEAIFFSYKSKALS